MPTEAWPMDTPMLPPLVLRPPHGPRLVRLLVVILAVMFHLATAGWSLITNGPEGELASAARDLWANGGWLSPDGTALINGPLALWLTRLSFALFGVNDFAARLPMALGAVVSVWFTLRLAERFGGIWRGFVAALILICSPGMFTLGRVLTPTPMTAAWITAAFYCLQCGWGSHQRPQRLRWMLLAWIAWGGAVLAGGWLAAGIVPAGVLILVFFYREARLRFRALLSWEGGFVLMLTLAIMTASGFLPGAVSWSGSPEWTKPVWQLACWQAGLLFPWSVLLLPAAGGLLWRLARLRPVEWAEAFPLAWIAAGVAVALADRVLFNPLLFWPAFAIWAALKLETLHRKTFLHWSGLIAVLAVAGLILTARLRDLLPVFFPAKAETFAAIPDFFWPAVTPVAFIAVLAFMLFAAAAVGAEFVNNRRFALLALFAAMIPAGFAFADIAAKFAPYFSDVGMARCIQAHPGTEKAVLFVDASRAESSSLRFYLGPDFRNKMRPLDQISSLWNPPAFLVTRRERLPYWEQNLAGRFETECAGGEHRLLSARPENAP